MEAVLREKVVVSDSDLRSKILAIATRNFSERGYRGTSVREIVEEAGCTKPALYYYFKNKETLFLEVIRTETDRLTRLIESRINQPGKVRDRLHRGLHDFIEHVQKHSKEIQLLHRVELHSEVGQPEFDFTPFRAFHTKMIQGLVQDGMDQGVIRSDIALEDATYALMGLVDYRMQMFCLGYPFAENMAERLVDLFFGGVGSVLKK